MTGTYDVVATDGTVDGYESITFSDGSELWMKYIGTTRYGPQNQQKGTATVLGGKGRYAGAKGDASYEGATTQPAATSGEAIGYIDLVINIK